MTVDEVVAIADQALFTVIKVAAPVLLISMAVGLIVSIFQTVTSIQEQTLTFVPKLLAIFIVLLLTGSWIMNNCVEFFRLLCESFSLFVR